MRGVEKLLELELYSPKEREGLESCTGWVLIKPSLMSGAWKAPPGSSRLILEAPNPCNSTKKKLPYVPFLFLAPPGS